MSDQENIYDKQGKVIGFKGKYGNIVWECDEHKCVSDFSRAPLAATSNTPTIDRLLGIKENNVNKKRCRDPNDRSLTEMLGYSFD